MTVNRPPLIAVDIGNSATKLGLFAAAAAACPAGELPTPEWSFRFQTAQPVPADLAAWLPAEPCLWHVASVHREGTGALTEWARGQRPGDVLHLLTHRDLPIELRVGAPQRVGLDRVAAAVAANVLRPANRPAIVVCAGSAITVNLVAPDGGFEGGAILPGFRMSATALFSADLLPLTELTPDDEPPLVLGKNTEDAIRSGLFWGAVGGVREIVSRLATVFVAPPIILVTGGDLRQFAAHLGRDARYVPNLVLAGIASAARAKYPPPGTAG